MLTEKFVLCTDTLHIDGQYFLVIVCTLLQITLHVYI
jgi:hypothetical protein